MSPGSLENRLLTVVEPHDISELDTTEFKLMVSVRLLCAFVRTPVFSPWP
jgi:hypothetical protein